MISSKGISPIIENRCVLVCWESSWQSGENAQEIEETVLKAFTFNSSIYTKHVYTASSKSLEQFCTIREK